MFFINKKLIKFYLDKKCKSIFSKNRSSFITKDLLGKSFIVYNGKKWLRKDIDTFYHLNKTIGSFKNLDTKNTKKTIIIWPLKTKFSISTQNVFSEIFRSIYWPKTYV